MLPRDSRLLSALLAGGVLATALVAALLEGPSLSPTATAAAACTYGVCPSNSGVSTGTIEAIIALLAAVAIILGVLIFRDRRRGNRPPPPEWADAGATAAAAPVAAGGAASYTEGPEDVSVPPPEVPVTPPASGSATGEGDIDSLMAELDRISGEILKSGPPKKGTGGAASDATDEAKDSGSG